MRKRCLVVLIAMLTSFPAALGTSGVSAQDATPAATAVTSCVEGTPEENAAVAKAYLGAWDDDHDFTVFQEVADPGVIHHWGQGLDDTVGIEDLTVAAEALVIAFPDLQLTYDDVIVEGDTVVIRWSASGTQDGPFFGIEPTGIKATWTGINIYRISCGKVVETWGEADGTSIRQQLEQSEPAATPQP